MDSTGRDGPRVAFSQVPMISRRYLVAHTHDYADPDTPIFHDGRVAEVAHGARLAFADLTCQGEGCRGQVHIERADTPDQYNLLILDHGPACRQYWAMLARAQRGTAGVQGAALTGAGAS